MRGTRSDRGPKSAQRPKVRIHLESRYRKLERGLPQTIFYCPTCKGGRWRRRDCAHCEGRGKLTDDSVQELIARVALPAFRARIGKFHGAGREDIDVRMLGRGRPFVYELVDVRVVDVDLDELRRRIHDRYAGRIDLEPFQRVARERVRYWKESQFDKIYAAEVVLESPAPTDAIAQLVGRSLEIVQRTPRRVAHRRADLDRTRLVEVVRAEAIAERALRIELRCQHGTYVKEWISGDAERTDPSLADLIGVGAHCASLDVLEICDTD